MTAASSSSRAAVTGTTARSDALNAGRDTAIKVLSTNNQLDQAFTGQLRLHAAGAALVLRARHLRLYRTTCSAFAQANYSKIEVLTRGAYAARDHDLAGVHSARRPCAARGPQHPVGFACRIRRAPWTLYQVLNYDGPINVDNVSNVWQMLHRPEGQAAVPGLDLGSLRVQGRHPGQRRLFRPAVLPALCVPGGAAQLRPGYQPQVGRTAATVGTSQTLSGYSMTCTTGLPVFQQFTPSADCLTSIADNMINETNLGQDIVEASVQGVWTLPRATRASPWAPPIAGTISATSPATRRPRFWTARLDCLPRPPRRAAPT